ncbi:hypothetical protein I4U23_031155 [Adineta vaga]|nr:hypothetical protein I4U23_031155 [Adineta vaga]
MNSRTKKTNQQPIIKEMELEYGAFKRISVNTMNFSKNLQNFVDDDEPPVESDKEHGRLFDYKMASFIIILMGIIILIMTIAWISAQPYHTVLAMIMISFVLWIVIVLYKLRHEHAVNWYEHASVWYECING